MRSSTCHSRSCCRRRSRQNGFTLFETILVIGILTLVSLGIMAMQPHVFKTQTNGRDQFVGFELTRACAERLLAVRRQTGYGKVDDTLCRSMGGVGGFANNVNVSLAPSTAASSPMCSNASATCNVCSSATCTATIIIAKTTTPAATLTPLTLQLSAY